MAILLSEKFGVFFGEWRCIDEHLMWIQLKIEGIWVTVVQVYAPTEDSNPRIKDEFFQKLQKTCMKCFDTRIVPQKRTFNYSLIHTRRVVEQAFGRLKGRWNVMDGQCRVNDPVFVWKVAMVCYVCVGSVARVGLMVVMGDMNARVGCDTSI